MAFFAAILIILSIPLLIQYFISEKKPNSSKKLAIVLVVAVGLLTFLFTMR
jgi:uncharacterized membrane protein